LASRVLAFCLSAFLAGLAGGLLGTLVQLVNYQTYNAFHSLLWLTVLVLAGARTFGGSIIAAVLLVAVPAVIDSSLVRTWQPIVFGVGAILLAQAPNGIAGLAKTLDFSAIARASRRQPDSRRSLERFLRSFRAETGVSSGAEA
jgi:ABC-type branched-subunit amino acid transport system permease subunit